MYLSMYLSIYRSYMEQILFCRTVHRLQSKGAAWRRSFYLSIWYGTDYLSRRDGDHRGLALVFCSLVFINGTLTSTSGSQTPTHAPVCRFLFVGISFCEWYADEHLGLTLTPLTRAAG